METKTSKPQEFEPDPPKKATFAHVLTLFLYHVVLAIFLAYAIYNVWPPQPWPGDSDKSTAESESEAAKRRRQGTGTSARVENQNASPSPLVNPANSANANTAPAAASSNTASNVNSTPTAPVVQEESSEPSTDVYNGQRPPPFFLFGRRFQPTLEVRLLLLVLLAGAIGSYIHASSSLVDYVGNRTFVISWVWWYLLRPFIGMMLALVFYFVFRGGFITAGVNQGGEGAASFINPFGIAAVACLVGMFSKVAADKLNEVFLTLFAPKQGQGDAKRGDKLIANIKPVIAAITPDTGPATGATPVRITGTEFLEKAAVNFGSVAAAGVTVLNPTTLTAVTPPHTPETVDVEVVNPNGLKAVLPQGFTFTPVQVGSVVGSETASKTGNENTEPSTE